MDSRAVFRMDMWFYIRSIVSPLLKFTVDPDVVGPPKILARAHIGMLVYGLLFRIFPLRYQCSDSC